MSLELQDTTIFLDSNVVFSGLFVGSETRRLLVALKRKEYRLVINPYVQNEVHKNVVAKNPRLEEELRIVLAEIEKVPDAPLLHRVPLALTDKPVLGAALACAADYLVTGNHRDFKHLYNTRVADTTIVSTPTLARLLL
jgi:predicted nucleic acid-binding protein